MPARDSQFGTAFLLWTGRQRAVLAGVVLALLGYFAVRTARDRAHVDDPPRHSSREQQLADRLDPNSADWSALATLPGLGEKRAREIVACREGLRRERPDEMPFARPADLLKVKGIGEATLAAIEPYLVFPESPATQP